MKTQKIIITNEFVDGKASKLGIQFENCDTMAALGMLRFYEKEMWLEIQKMKKQQIVEKQNEIFFLLSP